ncbi:CRISPR-associated endonuclease Cas2 [Thermovenabulum gondwanense]|uniref:CRISPR-associated endoribonuclease Cas2 n=1 Tax=Thermovenabulum gondwanense TaxID=520767 RepID=A0A162MTX9_9FIRM|nr:CRISPR-associated endonuclease Cas2 [Thermovenabulum gondwanense]KYO67328.1 CRISPR-associated endoribonuclease Cas2 [Thermovenabulum gondwanense]
MFVIITYDVSESRVNKVRKVLKKYLIWTQNSVFEGVITEAKLYKCLSEVNRIMDKREDSLYIYKVENPKNLSKDVLGICKNPEDMFL